MDKILLLFLLSLSLFACTGSGRAPVMQAGGHWIDVRSPGEFAAGHVPGAVNIPHDQIGSRIGEVTRDRGAEIHLYCRTGRRSGMAKRTLKSMGYRAVVNEGGVRAVLKRRGQKPEASKASSPG